MKINAEQLALFRAYDDKKFQCSDSHSLFFQDRVAMVHTNLLSDKTP